MSCNSYAKGWLGNFVLDVITLLSCVGCLVLGSVCFFPEFGFEVAGVILAPSFASIIVFIFFPPVLAELDDKRRHCFRGVFIEIVLRVFYFFSLFVFFCFSLFLLMEIGKMEEKPFELEFKKIQEAKALEMEFFDEMNAFMLRRFVEKDNSHLGSAFAGLSEISAVRNENKRLYEKILFAFERLEDLSDDDYIFAQNSFNSYYENLQKELATVRQVAVDLEVSNDVAFSAILEKYSKLGKSHVVGSFISPAGRRLSHRLFLLSVFMTVFFVGTHVIGRFSRRLDVSHLPSHH